MTPSTLKKNDPPAPAIVKTYFTLSKIISPIFFTSSPLLSKYGGFLDTVPERLGKFSPVLEILNHKRGNRHLLWIHAVSVGEAAIAGAITDAIRNRSDDILVAVSTTTFTGRDYIRRNCTPDAVFFFPIDRPSAMHKLVEKIRPDCFIDVEVELWPNCFRKLRLAEIPMALANGRISDRAANPPSFMREVYRWLFGCFDALFMRSEEDVDRVVELGAPRERTRLAGNLKFAACNKPLPVELRDKLRRALGVGDKGRLFVAGSTHPGEDEKIIASWRELNDRILPENLKPLIFVLAPRHLEQVERLRGLIANGGEKVELWTEVSDRGIKSGTTAIIVDTIGELNKLYGAADVAFVGGSLIKRGGHNVLEPVAVGTPTLHGPSMDNFHDLVRVLGKGGLLTEVSDSKELGMAILKVLTEFDISEYRAKAEKVIDSQTKASGMIADWVIEKIGNLEPGKGKKAEYRSLSERSTQSIFSVPANGLLSPLTHTYARISTKMVRSKIPGAEKLGMPVCSVGNISLGGTAKTPSVQYIAGLLAEDGRNPAVVLRGYMGKMDRENAPPKPVADGEKILMDWMESGDEAYLLGKNLIAK
ncbi:MAG: tetraacyldisaccharide 4'-kinase, partial [bacterium]